MATDDKNTELQTDNNDAEVKSEQTVETNDSQSQVTDSEKLDGFLASLNDKIDDLTKTYDKKIDDLKQQLDEKTKENEKLKNVNAQILMNTSVSKGNGEVDFNEAEFDDVNWDSEAKQYFGKIDSKIF
jgi:Fic family protein